MKRYINTLMTVAAVSLFVAASTEASVITVTYKDANRDNVVRADGDTNVWWTTSSYTGDDKWRERAGVWGLSDSDTTLPPIGSTVAGGEIYQSIDSGQSGKDAAALKMTMDGVMAGDNLYVIFWSDENGSPWTIRAGLNLGSLTTFSPYTGNAIEIAYDSAGRVMWAGDLGVVASAGSYDVFIDDLPTDDSNQRTWFDGLAAGYVIPEPATIGLLGLFGGGLLFLRRRRI